MATVDPVFPLIEVSGSAYEMGYQHGEQAAQLIRRYILWDVPAFLRAARTQVIESADQVVLPSYVAKIEDGKNLMSTR